MVARSNDCLKLYFDNLSQPSRALYMILKVSGKGFEGHEIRLLKEEHLRSEFKTINRFGKLPAIIDGDFKLSESVAILRYFSHKGYILDYLYPKDIQRRARIDEFLAWEHTNLRPSCSLYFQFAWMRYFTLGAPAAPGKVAKFKKDMERAMNILETLWLNETKFVTGDDLTAADVFGASAVEQLRVCGYEIHSKFSKVGAWIERVRNELCPHFDEAHHLVYKHEKETKAQM